MKIKISDGSIVDIRNVEIAQIAAVFYSSSHNCFKQDAVKIAIDLIKAVYDEELEQESL